MSPTGSKTGHPFLANGPRRSTRVGEPSRRSKVTHPKSRFLGAVSGQRSCRSNTACRMAFLDPFLFLSPSTSSSSARFRMRSWSARPNSVSRRRLPVSAFTLSPHQPPSRSFRTERGLRPPAFRLPREGRQLPGSRGAFHRLESTCTGLAPSAFIDRSSDHVGALLIGYPFP